MKNIILDKISTSWFMSTGEYLEHEFNKTPTFIKGYNKTVGQIDQRNGCGKTVVFYDGVSFALYGKVSRSGFKVGDIPFNKGATKKKCYVDLTFSIVENDVVKKCVIHRGINPSKLTLTVDGVDMSQSSLVATDQYIVKEILGGISIDVFKNSIAMKLDKSKAFMEMAKPDREKFIGGIFDLTYIKNAEKMARDEVNILKKDILEHKAKVSIFVPRINTIEEQIQKAQDDLKRQKDSKRAEIQALQDEIDLYTLPEKPEELDVKVLTEEVNTNKTILLDKLEECKSEDLRVLDEIKEHKVFIDEYNNSISKLNNDISSKRNEITLNKKRQLNLKSDIQNNINKNIKDEKAKTCPTCKRDMGEDCVEGIQETIKERLDINSNIEADIKKIDDENISIESVEIVNIVNEIEEFQNKINQVKGTIKLILPKLELNKPIIEKINKGINSLEVKRTGISQRLVENQQLFRQFEQSISKYDNMLNRVSQMTDDMNNLTNTSIINTLQEDLKNTQEDLKNTRKILVDKEYQTEVLEQVKYIFSENGIRKTILGKLVDLFNTNLNLYLKRLEAPCTIEFDDTFDYTVKSLRGTEIPYGSLSGGESFRVVMALAFTFKDILRIQNQISLSISIYDEWFDSAIDERGLDIVSELLQERLDKYNENCYIITHRTALGMENSNTITVVKEDHITTLED